MLASLAATRQASATGTRQRHCQTYGSSLRSVPPVGLRALLGDGAGVPAAAEQCGGRIGGRGGGVIDGRIGGRSDREVKQYARDSSERRPPPCRASRRSRCPSDRQLVHAGDADAGRRQRQRRHLRRLDHGPGRRRRRRRFRPGSPRAGSPPCAVNQFVFKQPVSIGDLLSFYATRRAHRQDLGHGQRRGLRRAQPGRPARRQGDRGQRSPTWRSTARAVPADPEA